MGGRALVVDSDPAVPRALRRALSPGEMLVEVADATECAARLGEGDWDLLVLDACAAPPGGLALLRGLASDAPAVLALCPAGAVAVAVAAMRAGAADVLETPLLDEGLLREAVLRGLAASRPGRAALPAPAEAVGLVGTSAPMRALKRQIGQIAPSRASVLIQGESGTGKELIARGIHAQSGRSGPFVVVSCAALSATLAESELFGHARGAFTGALRSRRGLFEAAQGGTLFLDEIGDLPSPLQVKLLRALQAGEIKPLGQAESFHVDVRLVAATHMDLAQAVSDKRFREDLYYRVAVITVQVPPLRDRRDDVPGLVRHFLERAGDATAQWRIDDAAMALLCAHGWPGNVRELENVVERAVVLGEGPCLRVGDLPESLRAKVPHAALRPDELHYGRGRARAILEFERRFTTTLLRRTRGNVSEAARLARLDRSNLRRILRRCGTLIEDYRPDPDPAGAPAG